MSTFRIHEEQENRGNPLLRQKQSNMAPVLQHRSVLGNLDNHLNTQNQPKGKQPLGILNPKTNNVALKSIISKPSPVVPVAQFEAFKVYEDTKENEENTLQTRKAKDVSKCKEEEENVKKEWFIKENIDKQEQLNQKEVHEANIRNALLDDNLEDVIPNTPSTNSPMSLEKNCEQEIIEEENSFLVKIMSPKDIFFESEEYRTEIFSYLREHELDNRPKTGYMRKQPDITYNMRTILVDWLVEVAQEYKLHTETLYLAINYIDRFLSFMSVVRGKLQLVGTAAMFIAAKYEEIRPPDVTEFVYITDDTYTKKQVIRMEHLILKVLSFDLSVPTPLTFITAIAVSTKVPEKVMYLAMYLSELSMLEADMYLETLPSILASAAIAVARYIFKMEPWTAEMKRSTGYDNKDLKKSIEFLYLLFCKAPSNAQQAIQEKYSSSIFMHVSKINPRNEDISLIE